MRIPINLDLLDIQSAFRELWAAVEGQLNLKGKRIINVGKGKLATDAATVAQVREIAGSDQIVEKISEITQITETVGALGSSAASVGTANSGGSASQASRVDHIHDGRIAAGWDHSSASIVKLSTIGDSVGIGTASPNSKLAVQGPISTAILSTASDRTLDGTDSAVFVDTTGGNRTITLPTAVGTPGREYTVIRTTGGVNTLTVATTGGQTINGSATLLLPAQYDKMVAISDGANWLRKV